MAVPQRGNVHAHHIRWVAPIVGAALLAKKAAAGLRGRVARKVGAGGSSGGDLEDVVPFELRGVSLPPFFIGAGGALLLGVVYDYVSGSAGSGGGLGAFVVIYAVPLLLIGVALYYAELGPVPVEVAPDAEGLFESKATDTLIKIKNDVTRHRYGDNAHLDSSLRVLGLQPPQGGKWPKMIQIKETKAPSGELEFTMLFESKDVAYTKWSDPAKIKTYDRYFGPGVWSQVFKESSADRVAGLKLTTGPKPEAAETSAASTAAATAAAAFRGVAVGDISAGPARFAGASRAALKPRGSRQIVACRANPDDEIERLVDENSIIVFSKSWCPFCQMAKESLALAGAEFVAVELDERSDGDDMQGALQDKTGVRTVPQVFIGGRFVGGGSDCQAMQQSGELSKMVAEVKQV